MSRCWFKVRRGFYYQRKVGVQAMSFMQDDVLDPDTLVETGEGQVDPFTWLELVGVGSLMLV